MNVTSTLLCRANQKIYELLNIDAIADGNSVQVLHCTHEGQHPLPCQLFAFPNSGLNTRYVAVYPDLPVDDAFYTVGEISPSGDIVDSCAREVSFKKAKWNSRLNYRTRKQECAEIRCIDERTANYGNTDIRLLTVISMETHMMFRITARWPENKLRGDFQVACLNNHLEELSSDFVLLNEGTSPSSVAGAPANRSVTFSIKVPWNQGDLFLYIYNESNPQQNFMQRFNAAEYDALRASSDRLLYNHAEIDPYYGEWLELHRATAYDLELQKAHQIANGPQFSIIVPLYKTPITLFCEMVNSVRAQSYFNWELILVNASPEKANLAQEAEHYSQADQRIKTITLDKNLGISENTNAGIAIAQGDYISFFDHDDLLEPNALYEYAKAIAEDPLIDLLYCDEDKLMPDGTHSQPFFKPDFSIDMLRHNNYICHMLTIKKELLDRLEPNTAEFDGAQDHNLTLEATEKTDHIYHVPKVLYHWRVTPSSTAVNAASKPYAAEAGIRAVRSHLERLGLKAEVTAAKWPFTYQVIYAVPEDNPLISIIIPTKNNTSLLKRCVESIFEKSTYNNFEVILVDNGSDEPTTAELYDKLTKQYTNAVRIVSWNEQFNFSQLVNVGVKASNGDYLLLLNNDTEVITENWLEIMLGFCARHDVGCVGAKLLYPDNTVQHAGVNIAEEPDCFFKHIPDGAPGYFNFADTPRDLSAVTGACMMTKRSVYKSVSGFDETLAVAYNDVDYCLKLREKGLLVVYTPLVKLYHYESVSRGFDEDYRGRTRFIREKTQLTTRWAEKFAKNDPYYTPNLRQSLPECCYYAF